MRLGYGDRLAIHGRTAERRSTQCQPFDEVFEFRRHQTLSTITARLAHQAQQALLTIGAQLALHGAWPQRLLASQSCHGHALLQTYPQHAEPLKSQVPLRIAQLRQQRRPALTHSGARGSSTRVRPLKLLSTFRYAPHHALRRLPTRPMPRQLAWQQSRHIPCKVTPIATQTSNCAGRTG